MKKITAALLALLLTLSLVACTTPAENTPSASISDEPAKVWYQEKTIEITAQQVDAIVNGTFETPKNVIILIGDGMGPNDITIASQFGEKNYEFGLVLERIPHHGLATTHSASHKVTDSAAAGTALATGRKANNKTLGLDKDGNAVQNASEVARQMGKKVGIVTDDNIGGATPSAFLVHHNNREEYDKIYTAALDFGPDVFIGKVDFGRYSEANERGYNAASRFQQIDHTFRQSNDLTKPFIGFNSGYTTNVSNELSQSTQLALKLLDNENGFFLMVESCGTDKYGHSNNMKGKIASVTNLDRTLAAILLFMKENPDTLLIVTSDHECGGVQLPAEGAQPDDTLFTTEEHTATPVRVFAVGKGSEYFNGKTVDNTEIGQFIIDTLQGK